MGQLDSSRSRVILSGSPSLTAALVWPYRQGLLSWWAQEDMEPSACQGGWFMETEVLLFLQTKLAGVDPPATC